MSRKRKAPKRTFLTDTKYKSNLILKLMNSIMYDGKKTIAEKIVYDALNKLQSKEKEEPIKIFETAINNIKPTIEVDKKGVSKISKAEGNNITQLPGPVYLPEDKFK